jgi:hypothetical protein
MRYAARLLELNDQLGLESPRTQFLELMAQAESNDPEKGTGADIFRRFAQDHERMSKEANG